jgi:orotidine-5'-phosphate decarboxylase
MTTQQIINQIRQKKSFLCIGLDTDPEKIPRHLLSTEDPVFAFNKAIIDATHEFCVAYKPNMAFYEACGLKGWKALVKTIGYLNENHPEIFTIADAKRGDIGNTSARYAKAFFEELSFDAITIAPYMGRDSVEPFLAFKNKHTILLSLTSNEGAFDFQTKKIGGQELYKCVLATSRSYANSENLMYVIGATKAEYLHEVRKIIPESFLLVPGVGAQGGDLEEVCRYGMTENIGLLINSSRAIIYASEGTNFDMAAAEKAKEIQGQMASYLRGVNKVNS